VDPADDPFAGAPPAPKVNLRDLLLAQGFNPDIACNISGMNFSYENMSEAELEWLGALLENTSQSPIQFKTNARLLMVPENMAEALSSGGALGGEEALIQVRKLSEMKDASVVTVPSITMRVGQVGTVEVINEVVTPEGTTWTGVKMVTTSVPYGLGSQTEFAVDSRPADGAQTQARERITLPENANGVAVTPASGGQKLVVLQGTTIIDATGRPIAPPP